MQTPTEFVAADTQCPPAKRGRKPKVVESMHSAAACGFSTANMSGEEVEARLQGKTAEPMQVRARCPRKSKPVPNSSTASSSGACSSTDPAPKPKNRSTGKRTAEHVASGSGEGLVDVVESMLKVARQQEPIQPEAHLVSTPDIQRDSSANRKRKAEPLDQVLEGEMRAAHEADTCALVPDEHDAALRVPVDTSSAVVMATHGHEVAQANEAGPASSFEPGEPMQVVAVEGHMMDADEFVHSVVHPPVLAAPDLLPHLAPEPQQAEQQHWQDAGVGPQQEPNRELVAEIRKARQSRKSSAYHQAKRQAKKAGLSPEEQVRLAKAAPCL